MRGKAQHAAHKVLEYVSESTKYKPIKIGFITITINAVLHWTQTRA